MEAYCINIQGLSNKIHHFDFEVNEEFFKRYGNMLVSEGNLSVSVALDKRENFIESEFRVTGSVVLVCDRSLDQFDFPIETLNRIIFKFGHGNAEINEEVVMIDYDTEQLDLGQLIYEFIGLSIPMKKLHPRFHGENESDEIVYSSDAKGKNNETDPRWDILKKLNKQ